MGFSKKEIMALLEKVKMTESQKDAIADIIFHNNQRIGEQLEYIIYHILDERERDFINDLYH